MEFANARANPAIGAVTPGERRHVRPVIPTMKDDRILNRAESQRLRLPVAISGRTR